MLNDAGNRYRLCEDYRCESLKIYQFSDAIQNQVHNFLSNGVVTSCIVVGSILFSSYQLFWMEKLAVRPCAHLIWKYSHTILCLLQGYLDFFSNGLLLILLSNFILFGGDFSIINLINISARDNIPTTVGSKSTNTALGTCLPAPVSLKKVLNESSPPPIVLSLGICPSGWMPCSKQYSSQQAFPIWTPACPTWIDIHSRCKIFIQYKL